MAGRRDSSTRPHTGITLVELVIVLAILGLLAAIVTPSAANARRRVADIKCASNLRAVGQVIYAFVSAHEDNAAAAIRDKDYFWNRGKQIGWDIETGRWARVAGGPDTIWQCPRGATPFMANARALGLDNREALRRGVLHRVGPRWWHEPWRLVLAYDVQNLIVERIWPHAGEPMVGDLSDEWIGGWPRDDREVVAPFYYPFDGPHDDRYGVLFADGHAAVGKWDGDSKAVLWSGLRWWPDGHRTPPGYVPPAPIGKASPVPD